MISRHKSIKVDQNWNKWSSSFCLHCSLSVLSMEHIFWLKLTMLRSKAMILKSRSVLVSRWQTLGISATIVPVRMTDVFLRTARPLSSLAYLPLHVPEKRNPDNYAAWSSRIVYMVTYAQISSKVVTTTWENVLNSKCDLDL